MTLREKQAYFWRMVALLITRATIFGTEIFILEWMRTRQQQEINIARGASKVKKSKHELGLAVDIAFILDVMDDGILNYHPDKYKALGEYWESLDPNNRWGGRFGDNPDTSTIEGWDAGHFEYNG